MAILQNSQSLHCRINELGFEPNLRTSKFLGYLVLRYSNLFRIIIKLIHSCFRLFSFPVNSLSSTIKNYFQRKKQNKTSNVDNGQKLRYKK